MKLSSRIWIGLKAISELGAAPVGLYALYQLGLHSGHYQRQLSAALSWLNTHQRQSHLILRPCMASLPDQDIFLKLLGDNVGALYEQADEILNDRVRLFGGSPVPLVLTLPEPLKNWTKYDDGTNQFGGQDIKYIWEPARFGWACSLATAYYLSGNEHYADTFWDYTDRFLTSNPPYFGPHWASAQEVAIRLIALAFAYQAFAQSSRTTPDRAEHLARAIAFHAERILPTMVYARSQSNNHLITEALGLYTAAALLPDHPMASKWHHLGWKWVQFALRKQIEPDGTYSQHSTNYHRLMLQAALWAFAVHNHCFSNEPFPPEIITRLSATTHWLWKLVDPDTGNVPNLGHNDGAYILPLTVRPYPDYRPVIYAAARSFLKINLVPEGPWNDMGCWLNGVDDIPQKSEDINLWRDKAAQKELTNEAPHILLNPLNRSWAFVHVAEYHSRPAHVDQLHLDLWWHGLNLAMDPGTYLYNSASPWDNSLTSAFVHNTVTVDNQEFMLRAGRYLYLDWAQANIITSRTAYDQNNHSLTAQQHGYRKMGITHSRSVTAMNNGNWEIIDHLDGPPDHVHTIRLHWLLPDWAYRIQDASNKTDFPAFEIFLQSPHGGISLLSGVFPPESEKGHVKNVNFKLARAGELLAGSGTVPPIVGYYSPTYGEKIPALAYIIEITADLPVSMKSLWILPDES